MLLSWYKPFEVFTLSLILIGPLHYFTEISWLDKRNYFAFSRSQFLLFIPVSFFITIGGLNRASPINQYAVSLIFGCFVYAFFVLREPNLLKNLAVYFAAVAIAHVSGMDLQPYFIIMFAVLLPTILHVLVFTFLFIIAGVKKNPMLSGFISVAVFLGCTVLLLIINPFQNVNEPGHFYMDFYKNMASLNKVLSDLFHMGRINQPSEVFSGDASYRIMSLVSFAYLYHYMNWFSKTEVIGWHRVSKKRLAFIVALWIATIGLYLMDHKTGINVILCLSLLHVLLEFPLNVLSLKQVFTSDKK